MPPIRSRASIKKDLACEGEASGEEKIAAFNLAILLCLRLPVNGAALILVIFPQLIRHTPLSLRSILFRRAGRPNVVFVIPDRSLDFQRSGLGAVVE